MDDERNLNRPSHAGARVVDDEMFRFLVDLEVEKAQRLRYCLTLACLTTDGVPAETGDVNSNRIADTNEVTDARLYILVDHSSHSACGS